MWSPNLKPSSFRSNFKDLLSDPGQISLPLCLCFLICNRNDGEDYSSSLFCCNKMVNISKGPKKAPGISHSYLVSVLTNKESIIGHSVFSRYLWITNGLCMRSDKLKGSKLLVKAYEIKFSLSQELHRYLSVCYFHSYLFDFFKVYSSLGWIGVTLKSLTFWIGFLKKKHAYWLVNWFPNVCNNQRVHIHKDTHGCFKRD